MTREEYAKRMKKHPDWAPGRDAIEAAFARRYPKTEPVCFESELHDRAAFGDVEPALRDLHDDDPAKVFTRDEPLFLKPCGVGIHAVAGNAVAYGVEGGLEEACIHGVVGVLGKEAQERAPAVFGLKLCKSTFFFHREFSK